MRFNPFATKAQNGTTSVPETTAPAPSTTCPTCDLLDMVDRIAGILLTLSEEDLEYIGHLVSTLDTFSAIAPALADSFFATLPPTDQMLAKAFKIVKMVCAALAASTTDPGDLSMLDAYKGLDVMVFQM